MTAASVQASRRDQICPGSDRQPHPRAHRVASSSWTVVPSGTWRSWVWALGPLAGNRPSGVTRTQPSGTRVAAPAMAGIAWRRSPPGNRPRSPARRPVECDGPEADARGSSRTSWTSRGPSGVSITTDDLPRRRPGSAGCRSGRRRRRSDRAAPDRQRRSRARHPRAATSVPRSGSATVRARPASPFDDPGPAGRLAA